MSMCSMPCSPCWCWASSSPAGWGSTARTPSTRRGPISADTDFTVAKGNNLASVGQRLEELNLIDNRYVFQLGGLLLKKQGQLKAGEYKLTAHASMDDVLKALTEGKPVALDVTIPEGFTVAQVIDRLNSTDKLTGDIGTPPPEGSLLPDTYEFDPGATRQSVLDRMQAAMQTKLAAIWQARDTSIPLSSPDQLVTLASIVEKETPVPDERAQIAAVYYNRLVKHMRLQSDPTVVYGITKGAAAPGRAPTRAELDQDSPYNTYQIDGLPPTPIDNPGIDALRAAANPTRSNNLYFVAVSLNPKDGHLFATNYADHRRNVAKLRAVEKQQAVADAEADADTAKDQLEQQVAAASGDPTASTPDASATPATPAPGGASTAAPAAPSTTTPTPDDSAAPATPDQTAPPASLQPAPATPQSRCPPNSVRGVTPRRRRPRRLIPAPTQPPPRRPRLPRLRRPASRPPSRARSRSPRIHSAADRRLSFAAEETNQCARLLPA